MNVVFFGNSDLSLIVLKKFLDHRVLVITSPDKPAGRGLQFQPNPVKSFCIRNSIQFVEDNSWGKVKEKISNFSPDFFVVASYGKIIPKEILELVDEERRLNIHPSLVPRWRGPAPVQWAILSGDKVTGVSIISVSEKVDSGKIFFQKEEPIFEDDNAYTLSSRLFFIAAEVLGGLMEKIIRGEVVPWNQSEEGVVWARAIKKEDGFFSFYESAELIHRKMRAFYIWPKIFTKIKGEIVKVHKTELPKNVRVSYCKVSQIYKIDERGIWVVCGSENISGSENRKRDMPGFSLEEDGSIIILSELQREGRKIVSGRDFANGMRLKVGDTLIEL